MIDELRTILIRFHRDSCYPDALNFEIEAAVNAIIAVANARAEALEKALRAIKARADRGGRRIETAMDACDDIEEMVTAALDKPRTDQKIPWDYIDDELVKLWERDEHHMSSFHMIGQAWLMVEKARRGVLEAAEKGETDQFNRAGEALPVSDKWTGGR